MTRAEMIADGIELGCPAFMAFLADALGLENTVKPIPLVVAES